MLFADILHSSEQNEYAKRDTFEWVYQQINIFLGSVLFWIITHSILFSEFSPLRCVYKRSDTKKVNRQRERAFMRVRSLNSRWSHEKVIRYALQLSLFAHRVDIKKATAMVTYPIWIKIYTLYKCIGLFHMFTNLVRCRWIRHCHEQKYLVVVTVLFAPNTGDEANHIDYDDDDELSDRRHNTYIPIGRPANVLLPHYYYCYFDCIAVSVRNERSKQRATR